MLSVTDSGSGVSDMRNLCGVDTTGLAAYHIILCEWKRQMLVHYLSCSLMYCALIQRCGHYRHNPSPFQPPLLHLSVRHDRAPQIVNDNIPFFYGSHVLFHRDGIEQHIEACHSMSRKMQHCKTHEHFFFKRFHYFQKQPHKCTDENVTIRLYQIGPHSVFAVKD